MKVKKFLRKLFCKKSIDTQIKPYVEEDTEWDKCEHLSECMPNLLNITMLQDTRQHYAKGLNSDCIKFEAELVEYLKSKGYTVYKKEV